MNTDGKDGRMKMDCRRVLVVTLAAVVFLSTAWADILHLKSGGKIEGNAVKEEEGYRVLEAEAVRECALDLRICGGGVPIAAEPIASQGIDADQDEVRSIFRSGFGECSIGSAGLLQRHVQGGADEQRPPHTDAQNGAQAPDPMFRRDPGGPCGGRWFY